LSKETKQRLLLSDFKQFSGEKTERLENFDCDVQSDACPRFIIMRTVTVSETVLKRGSSMCLVRSSFFFLKKRKEKKHTEKKEFVLLTSFAHAGNSKRRVKYSLFLTLDAECPRCTQPVQKIKDIKNISPRQN